MINVIFFITGIVIGTIICFILYSQLLLTKSDVIDDYKKVINNHNKRILNLIFINQQIKNYIEQQLKIIKDTKFSDEKETSNYVAARYMSFKEIQKLIDQLEKQSKNLNIEK